MPELSCAAIVEQLGFDAKEFWNDMEQLDGLILNNCTLSMDFSSETIRGKVYPELKRLKEKYKIDVPIGIVGVDVVRLDNKLKNRLWEIENGNI